MSNKSFSDMPPAERDAEAKKWESGTSFEDTRPLSKRSQALWALAKRGRGRPRKPAEARARRVLISLDAELFARVEAFASSNGLDRSKLFALSVQAFMAADGAHRQALASGRRATRKGKPAAATTSR